MSILDTLQDIVAEESTEVENKNISLNEGMSLQETKLDSYGFAIFWFSISDIYGIKFDEEWVSALDYHTYTIGELIKEIEEKQSETQK